MLIQETKPDIAHLHNIAHQLSPSIIHTLASPIPIVQTLHDYKLIDWNYLHYPRTIGLGEQLVLRAERALHQLLRSYSYIDRFIAPSTYMKDVCVRAGIRAGKITVIPYMVHPHPKPSPLAGEGRRSRASRGKPYLLFAGRLSPEKGLDVLLEAMKLLPNLRLKIVGDGPLQATLRDSSADQGRLQNDKLNNVQFLGNLDQTALQRLMANATALVVPSLWPENSPLVIYEAYTQGIPVIASNIGGIPELVQGTKTGFLVAPNNVQALAQNIKDFMALPEQTKYAMGQAGKLCIRNLANPQNILASTLRLYESTRNATIAP